MLFFPTLKFNGNIYRSDIRYFKNSERMFSPKLSGNHHKSVASKDTHVHSGLAILEKSLLYTEQLRHNYFSLVCRDQIAERMII